MKTSIKIKNLTHHTLIAKHNPDSNIPVLIDRAVEAQDKFQKSLYLDRTKTETEKNRLYAQSGEKQTKSLIDHIQRDIDSTQATINGYQSKVDGELKIKGTTDVVILNSYAQASEGIGISKLMSLARENVDIARSILLSPFLILNLDLSKKNKVYFQDQVAQHTLGEDYEKLITARNQNESLHAAGQGILNVYTDYVNEIRAIEKGVVSGIPDIEGNAA